MKYPILLPNIFNYPFTYESDLDLKIGEYVSVPFGKNKLTGVVWDKLEENEHKKFKLKKVLKKLRVKPLKKITINFLNWFSEYNIVPKGMALKLVLLSGKPVKIFDEGSYQNFCLNMNDNSIELTKEQKNSLNEISNSNKNFKI